MVYGFKYRNISLWLCAHPLIQLVSFGLFLKASLCFLTQVCVFCPNYCSCYANAVLQCLACTPPLTAYLVQGLHSKSCTFLIMISLLNPLFFRFFNAMFFVSHCINFLYFSRQCKVEGNNGASPVNLRV